ncbi:hypothetical protein VE03_01842 [Pseudogymnoascus sp. 23342-1-I1]|nr:hypothetical protein VE03_01842 [Pseudogymnoascus sp. 23342-1-I1]
MDSTSGRRNTNPPPLFSRVSTSLFNLDQFSHDGPSDPGQFPIQMSYPSQPVEGDPFIVRTLGTNPLDAVYNPRPSGMPEQRTLSTWHRTPTNPPQMSVGVSSTIPYNHTLASYVSNDEDPWTPSTFDGRLQPNSQPLGQFPVNQNPHGNRFQTEGDPVGGVILAKPQSDSGYGSLQSAYASSISNFDTGLLATGNQIPFSRNHGFQQTEARFPFGLKVASSEVSLSVPSLLHCPTCNKTVKTPSALRKHDQRHRKPFICPHSGCPGSGHGQGFGTANDLDRHIRSKHGDGEAYGRPCQMFSCHFSECQDKGRKFTRSDNYGVHLNKCHGMKKDEIKGIIQRKKEQYRLGAPSHIPQERSPDIPTQDARQDISFDHTMEQSNESLVTDGSHYEMYDHDDQGHGLEDVTYYMPPDQSRDLEDKPTHMLAETKYRQAGTMDMEYFSGMESVDTFEPADFIMNTTLDISESATPVATTTGATPKREDESNMHSPPDPHAQKAFASVLASNRGQDNRKSRGKGASQKPRAPKKDPVDRHIDTTLFNRNKPSREDSSPGDPVATDSKDEDCHTDSQDDDNAATILRDMKSRGYVFQRKPALPPEPSTPNPPSSSLPAQSQTMISCPNCPKTCRRPSEMAGTPAHTNAPSLPVPKPSVARTTGAGMRTRNTYTTNRGTVTSPQTPPHPQPYKPIPYKPNLAIKTTAPANTSPTTWTHSNPTSRARTKSPPQTSMPAPSPRAPSPPAHPSSTAASAPSPSDKPTGERASTTSMPILSGGGGSPKFRWRNGRRKVEMPDVKAKAEIKVQKKGRIRVPSTVIVTVEKTIRGGRDLVREGRRRFSRAAIAGEKRVKRATREGTRQVKRAWGGVRKSVS